MGQHLRVRERVLAPVLWHGLDLRERVSIERLRVQESGRVRKHVRQQNRAKHVGCG